MAEAGTLRNPNPSPTTFPAWNAPRRSIRNRSKRSGLLQFAGLSVAYHLLKHSPKDSRIRVDIYDEVGASGVSGGLIHPYSPKAKLLWQGKECWRECLELLRVAEEATALDELSNKSHEMDGFIVRRRGILRPAMSMKIFDVLNEALFLACQNLVQEASAEYTAVIVCAGAQADLLPELSSKLPLRICRGVAHMRLPESARNGNIGESPSILSDAWLAVQNSCSLYMGATWDWNSRNYSRDVSADEASRARPRGASFKGFCYYPSAKDWTFAGAMGGVRAMPPLTANNGSLQLLCSIDDFVTLELGAMALSFGYLEDSGQGVCLYHALLGKVTANAVLSCNEKLIPCEL
uniref:FAD dependent oxidoreductase domain-containing protein n=2 Tax=Kalanchoe fedtschenkoi TaxID=63787 RepID=A0A7N0U5E4_KALFE